MRSFAARIAALSFFILTVGPESLSAHPHVWISYQVSFVFESTGLVGFYEDWSFDRYNSEQILDSFDKDKDGKLNSREIEDIRRGYFDNIAEYSYFTTIRVDGKELAPQLVNDFFATVSNGLVQYQFFVPCPVPFGAGERLVTVTDWDPSYFVDFTIGRNPVDVTAPATVAASFGVMDDHQDRYDFPPDLYISQAPPTYLQMAVVRFRKAE